MAIQLIDGAELNKGLGWDGISVSEAMPGNAVTYNLEALGPGSGTYIGALETSPHGTVILSIQRGSNDHYLLRSSDWGKNWTVLFSSATVDYKINTGADGLCYIGENGSGQRIWLLGSLNTNGKLYRSADDGQTWTLAHTFDSPVLAISAATASGYVAIFLENKNAYNWGNLTLSGSPILRTFPAANPIRSAAASAQSDYIYALDNYPRVIRSGNNGVSWTNLNVNTSSVVLGEANCIGQDGSLIVGGYNGKIYRSTDLGATFSLVRNQTAGNAGAESALYGANGRLFWTVKSGLSPVVVYSDDNGVTWQDGTAEMPTALIDAIQNSWGGTLNIQAAWQDDEGNWIAINQIVIVSIGADKAASLLEFDTVTVRTGDSAYHFLSPHEDGYAYLEKTEGSRLGFAFQAPAEQAGELPLAFLDGGIEVTGETTPASDFMPAMTSNTAPAPYVLSGSPTFDGYPLYKSFNDDAVTTHDSGLFVYNITAPWFVQIDLGSGNEKIVDKFEWWPLQQTTYAENISPKAYTFKGSNDGSSWTTLKSVLGNKILMAGQTVTFTNTTAYRYYRWDITESNTATQLGIGEIRLWSAPIDTYEEVSQKTTLYWDAASEKLRVRDALDELLLESTTALGPDIWHYLEFGNGELRYNGQVLGTWPPMATAVECIRLGLVEAFAGEFYADDIVLSDSEVWHGPVRCHLLRPDEIVTNDGFSGELADIADDEETFVGSMSGKLRVGFEDLSAEHEILAVQLLSQLSVDGDGESTLTIKVGDEEVAEIEELTGTPTWHAQLLETNPATDAAWTLEEVNGLEASWLTLVAGPPAAPQNFTAQSQNGDVILSWQASDGAEDYVITFPALGEASDFVPQMTSNTAPSPFVVSANDSLNANYVPWKAFNDHVFTGSSENGWVSNQGSGPWWLKIDCGAAKIVSGWFWDKEMLTNPYGADIFPKNYTFQGSNDDSSWTTLVMVTDGAAANNQYVAVPLPQSFRYYRWHITASQSRDHVGIGQIRLMAAELSTGSEITLAPAVSATVATPPAGEGAYTIKARNALGESEVVSIVHTHS